MIRTFGLISLALMLGCGGGTTTSHDGGQPDATMRYDFTCGGQPACETTSVCCTMPGPTTTFACVDFGTCPPPDQILCDGPDDCGAATPVCCGVDANDGTGTYPQCGIDSLGTSCTTVADCQTHLATSCDDTSQVVLCHVQADCTDPTNNQCCTFASGSASLTFCTDTSTAQLAGAVCH